LTNAPPPTATLPVGHLALICLEFVESLARANWRSARPGGPCGPLSPLSPLGALVAFVALRALRKLARLEVLDEERAVDRLSGSHGVGCELRDADVFQSRSRCASLAVTFATSRNSAFLRSDIERATVSRQHRLGRSPLEIPMHKLERVLERQVRELAGEAHLAEAADGSRDASCYEYREGLRWPTRMIGRSFTAQCVAFGDFSLGMAWACRGS